MLIDRRSRLQRVPNEPNAALPTAPCAARAQVVAPHYLLTGREAPVHLPKGPQRVLGYSAQRNSSRERFEVSKFVKGVPKRRES